MRFQRARQLLARLDPYILFQGGRTGLIQAAQNGHLNLVRLLLDRGGDVNAADQVAQLALALTRSIQPPSSK
jgi:ankyrin repeat protein